MQKTKKGFSYVEMIAATALFGIVMLGALSLGYAAARNLVAASENIRLDMAASGIGLAVRDYVLDRVPLSEELLTGLGQTFGAENFRISIVGPGGEHRHGSPFVVGSAKQGSADIRFPGMAGDGVLVYVEVMNAHGAVVGRTLYFATPLGRASGLWRNAGG